MKFSHVSLFVLARGRRRRLGLGDRPAWVCWLWESFFLAELLSANPATAAVLQGARVRIYAFDGSSCRWPWNNCAVFSQSCKWPCFLAYNLVTAGEESYPWSMSYNRIFCCTENSYSLFIRTFSSYLLNQSVELRLGVRWWVKIDTYPVIILKMLLFVKSGKYIL